jgi:hypothetical protein
MNDLSDLSEFEEPERVKVLLRFDLSEFAEPERVTILLQTYLMPNHFHFLIRIKDENEIGYYKSLNSVGSKDSNRFKATHDLSEFEEPERVKT